MYGLLLENLSEFIKAQYGEDKWEEIRHEANIDQVVFSTHKVYREDLIPNIMASANKVLGVTKEQLMFGMGEFFVDFVGQYGYDRVLSVLGRHVRDFLNGLDNLHEYLKFSYPRMQPPSFFCDGETSAGMLLHYRSKRRDYAHYTMGQITQVARHFYNTELDVKLIRKEMILETTYVTFQLTFDNQAFANQVNLSLIRDEQVLPLRGNLLFEIFPFCILFGTTLEVKQIGNSMMQIMPELVGKRLTDWFDITRPHVDFEFYSILKRTNNIFELATSTTKFQNKKRLNGELHGGTLTISEDDIQDKSFRLKGQMMHMEEWKLILFLGTPVMKDLDSLIYAGLFINDLSMHDFSRDMILAGTQQSVELNLALEQEQQKSKKLEESMKKLDDEMRRTDELLYQMIPKQVAQRLRKGENPVDTCETFESVTILFSDVVTFTEICSRITPMEVVSMLNAMYSIFDRLTEEHKVYKVETIGDAYMVVAGAPERQTNHGEMVCNMALDMVEAITELTDPSTGNHLRIRVGVHTGMVVAGVVGLKMPRYCLFGDAVNTASRMESTSEAMRVHISQATKDIISARYQVEERGEVTVKGKGNCPRGLVTFCLPVCRRTVAVRPMKTYWLNKCEGRVPKKIPMVSKPQPIVSTDLPNDRRGSNVSRNYSPITFEDVARRSLTNTPTPALTAPVAAHQQEVSRPPDKPRARTYSNVGFASSALPVIESTPRITPTEDGNHHPLPIPQEMLERVRSTIHEKPTLHPTHNHHPNTLKFASNNNSTTPRKTVPLPDVLIDNHYAQNDSKDSALPDKLKATTVIPFPKVVTVGPPVEMVDRATSPVVAHSCSGFTSRNRVQSHTCVIL